GTRRLFNSWSGSGSGSYSGSNNPATVVMNHPITETANWTTQYYLTVNSEHGDPQGEGWYNVGDTATVLVDSVVSGGTGVRYVFSFWSGTGAGAYSGNDNPVTLIINSPVTETANWITQYYLTVISVRGTPLGQGWYEAGATATFSVDSLISGVTGTRYLFSLWSGSGINAYTGSDNPGSVILTGPVTEVAQWLTQHYLTVVTDPPGIFEISGNGWYAQGDSVTTGMAPATVVAEQATYYFKGWKLDSLVVSGNPISVLMDTSHVATADYNPNVSVVVTTNIGKGTVIIIDGVERNAPFTAIWPAGSSHTISVPSPQSGGPGVRYLFSSWSDGAEQTHVIAPEVNTTYIAQLSTQYYLTVKTEPADVAYIAGNGWYDKGTQVQTGLAPATVSTDTVTYLFVEWQVDSTKVAGNPISVTMDKPHQAIAYYQSAYYLSGKVLLTADKGLKDTKLILSGAQNDTLYADETGAFHFIGLLAGEYILTPQKFGFRFEPPSRSYQPLNSNQENQIFTAIDTLRPMVELVYPNGGEILSAGSQDTIRWRVWDNVAVDSIWIYFSPANDSDWAVIAHIQANDSSYIWSVPEINSNTCHLKILASDWVGNIGQDVTEATFSINTTLVADRLSSEVPRDFAVGQNYPNPFSVTGVSGNVGTTLQFQLPEPCQVSIEVYNVMGQLVSIVFKGSLKAGYHQVFWDGKDFSGQCLASGIYFYRIQAGTFSQIKRMLLVN
ncbi:MAG: T9SS type A sorting domain-containing protein, partial [candidate division KSB1 bacterium]|nr:T9SS type A sorting domain-containing protein [candidate division KSB1 bacterium]